MDTENPEEDVFYRADQIVHDILTKLSWIDTGKAEKYGEIPETCHSIMTMADTLKCDIGNFVVEYHRKRRERESI